MVTEWQLQEALVGRWLSDGVLIDGRRQFLVAWEVMVPSWRINDAHQYWAEPSVDFLLADADGRLTFLELKREVAGVKPCWRVLCQVTHRALAGVRSMSATALESAHHQCWSGAHGRVADRGDLPLAERHAEFFERSREAAFAIGRVGRVVAALRFDPRWDEIRNEFARLAWPDLIERLDGLGELTDGRNHREGRRLRDLAPPAEEELPDGVDSVVVAPLP